MCQQHRTLAPDSTGPRPGPEPEGPGFLLGTHLHTAVLHVASKSIHLRYGGSARPIQDVGSPGYQPGDSWKVVPVLPPGADGKNDSASRNGRVTRPASTTQVPYRRSGERGLQGGRRCLQRGLQGVFHSLANAGHNLSQPSALGPPHATICCKDGGKDASERQQQNHSL